MKTFNRRFTRLVLFLIISSLVGACASAPPYIEDTSPIEIGTLSKPNTTATIANLGPCTDTNNNTIQFDRNQPMTILVHGCNGSAGRFRSLAELYAFHGQQALCYSYDDRDSLMDSATQLLTAIDELSKVTENKDVSVVGHSMGGLVVRKAMEDSQSIPESLNELDIQLISISAPFAGIKSAQTCGNKSLHWLSFGLIPVSCWAITGDNWFEITSGSEFIRFPNSLASPVKSYLKVVTNEKDTCRFRNSDGTCSHSDDVFDLQEQYHPIIDQYPQVTNVQVDAGHVEIVGYKSVAPRKLLAILQQYGAIAMTPKEHEEALERLLAKLY